MLSLDGLRREVIRIGSYISDPTRRRANEALRKPLATLQEEVEALTPAATPDELAELEAQVADLNDQVVN